MKGVSEKLAIRRGLPSKNDMAHGTVDERGAHPFAVFEPAAEEAAARQFRPRQIAAGKYHVHKIGVVEIRLPAIRRRRTGSAGIPYGTEIPRQDTLEKVPVGDVVARRRTDSQPRPDRWTRADRREGKAG